MAEETFDLVFHGELVPGADLAQVKQNLARLFKMDLARVEKLFSGKAVVLKRGVTMDTAAKYRVAMKKAGARINTVASAPKPAPPVTEQVGQPSAQPAAPQPADAKAAQPTAPAPQNSGLSLAPVGGDLLEANEKQRQTVSTVDTSGLSLRPGGESLVDENERVRPAPVAVAEQHLDLAPAGADVLKPEERRSLPEVEMDLSHLSASEPGERPEATKPAPPPAPDVSRISLVEDA